ncbi:MAG: prepilin-type N-terminal cleavage/methylation domain-containing protein [Planctomycetes bacterium]|nr:prepilin-type N-terminal cleavage/methylation domain-containing protein [Planctomycetota bacterium]
MTGMTGNGVHERARNSTGFTLIEVLVVVALAGMLMAVVVPNLGMLVPQARLRGSGVTIQRSLDMLRSESRIQGKRIAIEFDLDKNRWRAVYPPEQQLTRDQDIGTLEETFDNWQDLEDDVVYAGIETGNNLVTKGVYRLVFDEFGFTADQVINLRLKSDPEETWSMTVLGLSGRVTIVESERGETPRLERVGEGAF